MSQPLAVDTSVAVPLLMSRHQAHDEVVRWWAGRELVLCGHAAVETYAVLTRLPGSLRVTPTDAAHLMRVRFGAPLGLADRTARELPRVLSKLRIAGGATYDAMIGLAALEHEVELATRDGRARATYELVGARVTIV